ncbi:hypothetical protein BD408DRAFT_426237 [Parasitella parasitica]|nr:hypothetical protein BD408DRAFT_426237 [Parasitella parasitica]
MTSSIELIVYLEPSKEFKQHVEHFLYGCKEKYGPTTANKYSCHITMTGFFKVNNEEQKGQFKQSLQESFQDIHKAPLPQVEKKSHLIRDKMTELPIHLLLPVLVPDEYYVAMENITRKFDTIAKLRPKKINHISLAYWDEPQATQEQQRNWCAAVSGQNLFESIQKDADVYFCNASAPTFWDVVLYQRVKKGELVGESHVFQEQGRWRV